MRIGDKPSIHHLNFQIAMILYGRLLSGDVDTDHFSFDNLVDSVLKRKISRTLLPGIWDQFNEDYPNLMKNEESIVNLEPNYTIVDYLRDLKLKVMKTKEFEAGLIGEMGEESVSRRKE